MINWRIIRQFPKYALVFGVIIGSSIAFAIWWFVRSPKAIVDNSRENAVAKAKRAEGAAKAEAKIGQLLLIDNDLCAVDSGEILIKGWLKGEPPVRLLLEPEKETFIAQYERAFIRYSWEGAELAKLVMKDQLAVSMDYKFLLWVKDKDIWQADIDWKTLKLANNRQVTSIHQFMDTYFAQNILLGSDKTIVVRNMNTQLRVNLETGEVRPGRFPLANFAKQRTPDGKMLVGVDKGAFFSYDVDSEELKTIPLGRAGIFDYLWLDNSRCVVIEGGKTVKIYGRAEHALIDLVALPFPCRHIELLSPTARFFFCSDNARGVLVDVEKKTAVQVAGGQGVTWVNDETFLFSRDTPDSRMRGIWAQSADNKGEQRILKEACAVSSANSSLAFGCGNVWIISTDIGLYTVDYLSQNPRKLSHWPSPPKRLIRIVSWNTAQPHTTKSP